jgi:hypothetical protein
MKSSYVKFPIITHNLLLQVELSDVVTLASFISIQVPIYVGFVLFRTCY